MASKNPIANAKSTRLAAAQKLIAGTQLHFPDPNQALVFGGTTRAASAVTQLLQSVIDLRSAVEAAQAGSRAKVALEKAQSPSLDAAVAQYVAFLRATFGEQPDVLADFGIAPFKQPKPLTAEQKAAAAAKRKATRQARHTMGKNQKQSVKGAVSATLVVTPLPEPNPAPSPPPTPPTPVTSTSAGPSTAVSSRPSTA